MSLSYYRKKLIQSSLFWLIGWFVLDVLNFELHVPEKFVFLKPPWYIANISLKFGTSFQCIFWCRNNFMYFLPVKKCATAFSQNHLLTFLTFLNNFILLIWFRSKRGFRLKKSKSFPFREKFLKACWYCSILIFLLF